MFARGITDDLTSLVKKIDKVVVANDEKKMAAFLVDLTDDPDVSEETLATFGKKHEIKKVALSNFDGSGGPPVYKIAKDADVTVMMWVKGKVKVNYALRKGELTKKKIDEIVAATAKILK